MKNKNEELEVVEDVDAREFIPGWADTRRYTYGKNVYSVSKEGNIYISAITKKTLKQKTSYGATTIIFYDQVFSHSCGDVSWGEVIPLIETVIKQHAEWLKVKNTFGFYCFIPESLGKPKYIHKSYISAREEAVRLTGKTGYPVQILRIKDTVMPKFVPELPYSVCFWEDKKEF